MGNTPSAEAPRKAPQKLSKPRAASHGAVPRPRNLTGAAASSSTRISESYLAASIPFSSRNSQCITVGGNAAPEPYVERLYEPSRRLSRRESEYMRSPVLPESPNPDSRTHSFHTTSAASNRRHRSSVIHDDAERPLARTQSWHGNRLERGTSMQTELIQLYASQQLPRSSSEFLQELKVAAMNSQVGMHHSPSPSPSPSQSQMRNRRASSVAASSIARTGSDLSIYAPIRRRSVVQTPGVATRPRREDMLSIPDRSIARKSQPVFADDQYTFKASSKAPKHLSMPLMNMGFAPLERAVTPCESDYKQLGGIKFGSLVITNGSPPSSPRDKTKQHQRESSVEPPSGADDSGIELNMARRKNRPVIVGSQQSRALASATGLPLGGNASQRLMQTALDDLMPSPLSKVPSPLMGYIGEMGDNEAASGNRDIGVWRSNSGFSSATSSASSRANSKTDSGYSSNVSERSFPGSTMTDTSSRGPSRRPTLEQPTMTPLISSIDSLKKSRQLYNPFVRGASPNDMAKDVTAPSSVFTRPKVRRHEKHLMASSSGLLLHRMDASTATLNTILSVDNLTSSDNAAAGHGNCEVEVVINDSKSLRKRRSLRKVAEAATSRMPSLSLSRRKSAAGDMRATSPSKADAEKRRRATSVTASNRNPAPLPQPPKILDQRAKGSSLKDRASAPELRVAIPDNAQFNRNASNRSSIVGTPSPRTPRTRGVVDSGVPPPIPPQFRAPAFNAPLHKSADWPLAQPHRTQAQAHGGHVQAAQNVRRSMYGGAMDSPVSPRHSRLARSNPPTYRGVQI